MLDLMLLSECKKKPTTFHHRNAISFNLNRKRRLLEASIVANSRSNFRLKIELIKVICIVISLL